MDAVPLGLTQGDTPGPGGDEADAVGFPPDEATRADAWVAGATADAGPAFVRRIERPSPEKDEAREERITMEIVVDAYGEEERAMSWYYYLEQTLNVPFRARCVEEREVSPLSAGDEVEVVGMPPERECEREMFVSIRWGKRKLAVPLAQLEVVEADDETREAVEDWHYWVGMGYCF